MTTEVHKYIQRSKTIFKLSCYVMCHSRDCWRKCKWPSIKRNVSDFQHLSFNFYPRKNDTTRFYRHSGKVLISFSILVAQIRKRTHSRKTSVFRWKNGDKFNRRRVLLWVRHGGPFGISDSFLKRPNFCLSNKVIVAICGLFTNTWLKAVS